MNQSELDQLSGALSRAQQVAEAPIQKIAPHWLRESAITLAVIHLNDALQKLSTIGERISFNDDVEDGDITDLIARYRNAACHFGSKTRHIIHGNTVSFAMMMGAGTLMQIYDVKLESPYADDISYFYGRVRLLHNRQLTRAVTEASVALRRVAERDNLDLH